MPFIVWTSEMSVDVKMLDNDHKRLAILINDLHAGLMAGRDSKDLDHIFDELIAYARVHFAQEERILAEAGYSGAEAHKLEHEQKIKLLLSSRNGSSCIWNAPISNLWRTSKPPELMRFWPGGTNRNS